MLLRREDSNSKSLKSVSIFFLNFIYTQNADMIQDSNSTSLKSVYIFFLNIMITQNADMIGKGPILTKDYSTQKLWFYQEPGWNLEFLGFILIEDSIIVFGPWYGD